MKQQSLTKFAREQREKQQSVAQTAPTTVVAPPMKAADAPFITVQATCGHDVTVRDIPSRVLQAKGIACGPCRDEAHKKEVAAQQAKKEAKAAKKGPRPMFQPRLPVGSIKTVEWLEKVVKGTLTVPGVPEPFWFEASSEMKVFHGLDGEYRKYLAAQTGKDGS